MTVASSSASSSCSLHSSIPCNTRFWCLAFTLMVALLVQNDKLETSRLLQEREVGARLVKVGKDLISFDGVAGSSSRRKEDTEALSSSSPSSSSKSNRDMRITISVSFLHPHTHTNHGLDHKIGMFSHEDGLFGARARSEGIRRTVSLVKVSGIAVLEKAF